MECIQALIIGLWKILKALAEQPFLLSCILLGLICGCIEKKAAQL